jgi:uncharacterized protein (TIGR04255 family)
MAPIQTKYIRAPIIEAIVDFQYLEPIDLKVCEKVKSKLANSYPIAEEAIDLAVKLDTSKKAAEFEERSHGFRLSSDDQTDIVIVADRHFAVARLAPYLGWQQFRDRAAANWKINKDLTGYRKIARIGVRYINRIDIPTAESLTLSTEDYFAFRLEIPQPPFPPLAHHVMQADFREGKMQIVVNSARVPSALVNHLSFILDIDISRREDVPQSDDGIWAYLDEVRILKNTLFESCITDKTRELFK